MRSDRYLAKTRAKFTKNAGSLWMFNVTIDKMRQMILHPKIVRFDLKWFDCHFTKMSGTMEQTNKETNTETKKQIRNNTCLSRGIGISTSTHALYPRTLCLAPFRSKVTYAKIIMEI